MLTDTLKKDRLRTLEMFTKGASPAQLAQISMIKKVFDRMDADGDGLLSPADVRAYFRAIGRNANDSAVRHWMLARDIDQDGSVSLAEFISSYALQLDPNSSHDHKTSTRKGAVTLADVSAVTAAFGVVSMGCTPPEAIEAINAIEDIVRRALLSPTVKSFWRLNVHDAEFQRRIGRLFGGVKLMHALGFEYEDNGNTLAIRDSDGKQWDALPAEVQQSMGKKLEELLSHRQALLEPSISNVAAGLSDKLMLSIIIKT